MIDKVKIKQGPAPSFGWVRRPDLDTAVVDAWEMPDGKLYAAPKGNVPIWTTGGPPPMKVRK